MTIRAAAADGDLHCDVVVVGAGSAGCAVASVLAVRHGMEVVLAEAGPPRSEPAGADTFVESSRPGRSRLVPVRLDGVRDADYRVGAGVGGGGAINAMLSARPDPRDFDIWAERHGCDGWSWKDVEPVFERLAVTPRAPSMDEVGPVGAALLDAGCGAAMVALAEHGGVRQSSDVAYLAPIAGSGRVVVRHDSPVRTVRFDPNESRRRADGVVFDDATTVTARGVVVCAGALATPRLLADSGVAHPQLGLGLMDHPTVMFAVSLPEPSTARLPVCVGASVRGGQILAYERIDSTGRWAGVSVSLLDVESRGRVLLESPLVAQLALLGVEHDVRAMVALVRTALEIIASPSMSGLGEFRCDDRGTPAVTLAAMNDSELVRWLTQTVVPLSHVAGGCAMGPDGPLTSRCAVRGVSGLWVADASVMPRIVRANPNLTVTMIGDKVADHVAEDL